MEDKNTDDIDIHNNFNKSLKLRNELLEQADDDIPLESRSKHLYTAIKDAEDFLIEHGVRRVFDS